MPKDARELDAEALDLRQRCRDLERLCSRRTLWSRTWQMAMTISCNILEVTTDFLFFSDIDHKLIIIDHGSCGERQRDGRLVMTLSLP